MTSALACQILNENLLYNHAKLLPPVTRRAIAGAHAFDVLAGSSSASVALRSQR